jgi:dienelactone hydrolase
MSGLSALTLVGLLFAAPAPAQLDSEAGARQTMSELLKIPLAAPYADVEVLNRSIQGDLIVEDLAWAAPDGQRVTAFLIRPVLGGRLPAVICLHGTGGSRESETAREFGPGEWTRPGESKPHTRMLGWARELARRGFVTLALTQRGLDRRAPPDTNDQAKDLLVRGRTLMGAIVQEIRQAVTYLEQRDDVARGKTAVSGMSFGGITAFYTWLVDRRVNGLVSICGGVGSIDALLREGRPSYHGFYWWVPGMLTRGDQADFAAALAPRPLMLWAPQSDIGMPKSGVDRFAAVVRPAYTRAKAEGRLVIHQPPGEHEFTIEAFEAMTVFLHAALNGR